MSDQLYAIILGIVQGIAEFLPISSSAHLIIVSSLLEEETLPLVLNVALHVGTLLAVLVFFWREWLALANGLRILAFQRQKNFQANTLFPSLIIGSIPAGVIGILWQDDIEAVLHHPHLVIGPLAIVGILMWWVDKKMPDNKGIQQLSLKASFLIGIAQACALIPGTSRSGATILAGRLLGFSRVEAAKFSFMLGTPAMGGAALLNFGEILESLGDPRFYIGTFTAFIVGCLAIKFLLAFLARFGFASFAIYRVLIAVTIFVLI